jgi:peptidyl-prolyl cis-trans isomerase D
MLATMRKYSTSVGIKALYVVLAVLFVGWGVGAVGDSSTEETVARVYGQDISRRDVDVATENLRRQYEELLRGQFAGNLLNSLNLDRQALDQLLDGALLVHEADRLGIAVSDAEVREAIVQMPEFQENGRFSRERLREVLDFQRDRGEFQSQLRRGLVIERLQGLVSDGIQVSDGEARARWSFDHEKAKLAFVKVSAADRTKGAMPTDEDLQKWLDGHADQYRVPEQVRVRYVVYRPADFEGQVSPTDGEVAEYYALHKEERWSEPEQVRARHLLVKAAPTDSEAQKAAARKKAEGFLAEAKGGADFAALAKKHSADEGTAPKGGDLGFFGRGRMAPTFEEAAFALEAGQLSGVIETPFGFHVIKVEERRPAGTKPLDAVRVEIVETLKRERAADLARAAAVADRKRIVAKRSLRDALTDRTVVESPPFGEKAEVAPLGRVPDFTAAAFALGVGQASDLVEEGDTIYLLEPMERLEAHTPPLAEVRERVLADVRKARGEEAARKDAETLLARAREIGLDKAAAEAGLPVEETDAFERRGAPVAKLGNVPQARIDAFTLTPAAPLGPQVYDAAGDAVVISLRERTPVDPSGFEAAKNGVVDSLLQQKRAAAMRGYVDFLKRRAAAEGAWEVKSHALPRG